MDKIITKIEAGKKNKNRVNIFLNEEFSFACSMDLVYYYKLEKGKKVDLDLLSNIIEEDNYIKGKNDALRIIEKSYKSKKEIVDKLLVKGYEEKTITRIIEFLEQYNFINDEKYAEMFIKDKSCSNGKKKIKYMLIRKGIDEDIINNKLKDVEEAKEREAALRLAQKKYGILIKSETNEKKVYKKIGDYLAGRGYNFDIINSTLNKIIRLEDSTPNKENIDNYEDGCSNTGEEDLSKLKELAEKRYRILLKSDKDYGNIYRKLSQYLLRRGYNWDDIKKILKGIVDNE